MEAERFFADEWPAEMHRLRRVLAAKGVRADDVDDVLQETALRLYAAWGRVFEDRPLGPLVTTIALNVARDQHRRERHRPILVPDVFEPMLDDVMPVDRTAIARLEVARTARALASMPPAQRRVLARAVADELAGEEHGRNRAPAAFRMALTRARRQLAAAVELAGCLLGIAYVCVRRLVRSPVTPATALGALGVLAVTVVATGGGTSAPRGVTALRASTAPRVTASEPLATAIGTSWWSAPRGLAADVPGAGFYSGTGEWVVPTTPSRPWGAAGPSSDNSGSPASCDLRLLTTTVQYPCVPVV